jgi:two-component system cell cycle response regulator DivK
MSIVLVIEDIPANMLLTSFLLETMGYTVIQAHDATQGISIAKSEQPNLIIMDIHLPEIDGLTATRLLKSDGATQHIPILILTSLAMPEDHIKAKEAGCNAYLTKPLHHKALEAKVRTLLAK